MLVAAEIEPAARVIAAGIGCPVEMIWGGLNWSGASVSLRVLENHFLNTRENHKRLIRYLIPKLGTYFRLPKIDVELSEFKMADDVQQQANAVNLMLQGYLSRESVVNEMGYDSEEEFTRLEGEHEKLNRITMKDNVAASHMNTVIQSMEAKAQVLLKYEMQMMEEAAAAQHSRIRLENIASYAAKLRAKGMVTPLEFEHSAILLQRMDPRLQQVILQSWQTTMPMVTLMLMGKLGMEQQAMQAQQGGMMGGPGGGMDDMMGGEAQQAGAAEDPGLGQAEGPYAGGGDAGGDESGIDTDPLPEQRPPRREESPV
jgi:hypothetical protein